MSQKLSEKVALITGGTSGIDLATAKRFVAEGAYVFITGITNGNSYMSGVAPYALKLRKKAKAT